MILFPKKVEYPFKKKACFTLCMSRCVYVCVRVEHLNHCKEDPAADVHETKLCQCGCHFLKDTILHCVHPFPISKSR